MRNSLSVLLLILRAVLAAVVFSLFTRTFLVQVFRVPSTSMMHSLLPGDHILVNKFIYRQDLHPKRWLPQRLPRTGEVVVFRFPPDPTLDFVKRCAAGPFDHIQLGGDGLRVNGRRVESPSPGQTSGTKELDAEGEPRMVPVNGRVLPEKTWSVPADEFFFLGDHRQESFDSRYWGSVPRDLIKGRALLILWSAKPLGERPSDLDLWGGIRHDFRRLGAFFWWTRSDRCFQWVR